MRDNPKLSQSCAFEVAGCGSAIKPRLYRLYLAIHCFSQLSAAPRCAIYSLVCAPGPGGSPGCVMCQFAAVGNHSALSICVLLNRYSHDMTGWLASVALSRFATQRECGHQNQVSAPITYLCFCWISKRLWTRSIMAGLWKCSSEFAETMGSNIIFLSIIFL